MTRKSLPAVLSIAFIVVLVAAAAVGWNITSRYEALFFAAKTKQTQHLLDEAIAAKLWRQQFARTATVAQNIANMDPLRRAVQSHDAAAIHGLLVDEFHRDAVSSGAIALIGITLYDAAMTPVGDRWLSEPEPIAQEIIVAASSRTGIHRLGVVQFGWRHQGSPRVSVFAAMGLRAVGYVGLHIDPLPALAGIDEQLATALQVVSKADGRPLFTAGDLVVPAGVPTYSSLLRLHGPGGEHLADVRVAEDVPELSQDLAHARWTSAMIFVAIAGGVAVAAGAFLYFFLREVRRREQTSEERFRDYAETASDWFWETDKDHHITYVSDRIRAFGQDPATRIGRSRLDIASESDNDPAKWQEHFAVLERHESFRDFVYTRKVGTQPEHTVSVSGKPIFNASGEFLGYRGSATDVTLRIMTDRQLRDAKADAEASRDAAIRADRAKSEFLANMSHELRTPLNAIIGFSEVISKQIMGPVGNIIYQEYAKDIHGSGHHLLRIINDILDLSKIHAGKLVLDEDLVDIPKALGVCIKLVDGRAHEAGVKILIDVPHDLPRLYADELRFKQIILNLLSNAVKFTPDQGSIIVSTAQCDDGALAINVMDTGIGMTAEEIAVALQPFRQVENSLSRRHEGTGLGLPLAKELVEMHGGALHLESVPGHGTTATIVMPSERFAAPLATRTAGGTPYAETTATDHTRKSCGRAAAGDQQAGDGLGDRGGRPDRERAGAGPLAAPWRAAE
jgi:PAS domain S-box-containing protein